MASLNWNELPNQPAFDKVVEAFIVKDNADLGKDAYAVNGRGGDQGIDIRIRRDNQLNIVQLKFFPEGFSGGFSDRKKQILKSFKSALQHDPDRWTLVVPVTLTPQERKFVLGLPERQNPPLSRPEISIADEPQLNALAARHPDLVTYFKRDELLDAAREYNQERSLMVHQDDLSSRLASLAKQGDTLDPDWRLDTFTEGDITGTILVPKHPHAADRSPITLQLTAEFGPDDSVLKERFEKVFDFGGPERIDLPASVVKAFTVDGPPAFAKSTENAEISFIPTASEHVGKPFVVAFFKDDRRVASFNGKTTWLGGAHVGGSIHAEFYNALTLKLRLPFDKSSGVSIGIDISFKDCDPVEVVRAVDLLERILSGESLVLELDGKELARLLPPDATQLAFVHDLPEILAHRDVANDLIVVQQQTSQYFPYPETIPSADRVDLRCLRLLLEGQCIVLPGWRELEQALSGVDGKPLRQLLISGPQPLSMNVSQFGLDIFGHDIEVGAVALYAPQISTVEPEAIIRALDTGTAAGMPFTLRCEDGYGIWAFLADRLITDEHDHICPVSLGLPDAPDAPDIARARETIAATLAMESGERVSRLVEQVNDQEAADLTR